MNKKKQHPLWTSLKNGWMAFAHAVGWFNTRLLLSVFYVILGIPAIFLKLIRKDLLSRSFENRSSYWQEKENVPQTLEQSKHQF